jgi:hypothetical protein
MYNRTINLKDHFVKMLPLFDQSPDSKVLVVSHSLLLTMWMCEGLNEGSVLGSGCINSLFFNNTQVSPLYVDSEKVFKGL